jgi:glycosyltransferase involved in cell wall biosynthesis
VTSRCSILELRSVRGTGGGPEKTILLGAARRDTRQFDVTVCYLRDGRDRVFGIDDQASSLPIDYVEVRERHSFDPRIWRSLKALLRDRHVDIVHGHDYKADLLAWLLCLRTGRVPLSTAHGWTGDTFRERHVYYPAHRRLLARFPRVIAVSNAIKGALVRVGARPDRVTVLLNGIDTARRRLPAHCDSVRRSIGCGPSDVVLGAVGRLERQKRFDILIDVFAGMAAHAPRLRLVLAGEGRRRSELESQAARLGVADRCTFVGHMDDVANLHHAFDVFVQSSEYEGTPNAVLEAMAMETPLVATDAGGTRELVTDGVHGLIVPIHDPEALSSAIRRVLDDPDAARQRAVAARLRIEDELSFEARTRRLEAIYLDLLASRPRADANAHVTSEARRA